MGSHEEDLDTLLGLLGIEDLSEKEFRVYVMETFAHMLLTIHWLRGRLNYLLHMGTLPFNEKHKAHWRAVDKQGELREAILWKLLPPRALVRTLVEWRRVGRLDKDIAALKKFIKTADELGRPTKEKKK